MPVFPDLLDEPDESFAVTLAGAVAASIADGSAVVTITDDDAPPALAIGDVTVAEGQSGSTAAQVTVTLGAPSGRTVSVAHASAGVTATAGVDFVAAAGALTFAPGVVSQVVVVPITGDAAWEPDETLSVTLSGAVNATIGDGVGVVTIANDDPVPPGPITATFPLTGTADDVNEVGTDYQATQATVWLGNGGTATTSVTGLRFTGVDVPRGSTIVSARLEVNAAQTQWISLQYQIGVDDVANSAPFTTTARPSARVLATPRVNHSSNVSWVAGTWYAVDGLGPLVQAITSRADWARLNSLSLVLRGTGTAWGRKFVRSRDAGTSTAPRLVVVYNPPSP